MRLFLASQDLGDFANVLRDLVGDNHKAFIISNARDYYNDANRIAQAVEKSILNLGKIGLHACQLDLKNYFGKSDDLAGFIQHETPGLIFAIGGNVTCLATALHESGMDRIICQGVSDDAFVYGGYSAGAMIASSDLSLYDLELQPGEEPALHRMPEITKQVYDLEPYRRGLGLISEYVIPHADYTDHAAIIKGRTTKIQQSGAMPICLNDGDVFVVNGRKTRIFKAPQENNNLIVL